MNATILGPLVANADASTYPLYPQASCGCFNPAEDYVEERLSLDELVGLSGPSTFLVRASGDSMIEAGIYDQDVLIVDRAKPPALGQVVIARVGAEFVVKQLGKRNDRPILIPANRHMAPIELQDGEEVEIWGVCQWNLHRLNDR